MDKVVAKKLDQFFSQFKSLKLKKGEILIEPDQEPSGVFYLKDGVVKRYSISSNGDELILNTFRPISFFPMSWVINNSTSSHYFEAASEIEVYKAPKNETLKFLKENPDVAFDLLSRIYKGMDGLFLRMEYLMAGNAQGRLLTELLIYGRRFGDIQNGKVVIKLKLTEKDIASQTGISRETVSRELQKLKKDGLIEFENSQLTINNLKELQTKLIEG